MKEMLKEFVIFGLFFVVIILIVSVPESGCEYWGLKFLASKVIGFGIGSYMIRLMHVWNMIDFSERA